MSRPVIRRLLVAGATAGLATAGGIALASAHSGGTHPKPRLSERQILRIAENAAARAGDRHPTLIQHAAGTRHDANRVASGDGVPGRQWSYLIAERGRFVLRDVSRPPGARAPRGSVLTLVVDASSGDITDFGVSNHYPDLAKLGPVHTDLRRSQHPRAIEAPRSEAGPRYSYAIEIQAGYDRRGNPTLGANFTPNGGLAKPRWAICSPPNPSICTPVQSSSQFIQPGPRAAGTVFQASATYRGRRYTARSAVWTGRVHATRPPWLEGQARAGARVDPQRAVWTGGWKADPGYRAPLGGFSGGRGRSFESLSVEACRTASGENCVNLTRQGQRLDFAQHSVTVPARFTGWYLFGFDEHFPADTAWAEPAYSSPFAIPPLKLSATVVRSAPVGPVRNS